MSYIMRSMIEIEDKIVISEQTLETSLQKLT